MLVLCNGKHLLFGQAAKGHAVFKGNHEVGWPNLRDLQLVKFYRTAASALL